MGEFVKLEVEGAVATVRLDRPPMNAISKQVVEELRDVAAEIGLREDVRAVVLWGGEKLFAAGADVKEFRDMGYADMARFGDALSGAFTAIARIPKPVIAAITGFALGGGCELALCADFRVAAEGAQLGQPEILLGLIPGAGGTQRLPRLIGIAKAKDLIYSGRFVGSDEALELGLVDAVVPADEVYAKAVEMATTYAKGPAVALQAAKAAIDQGVEQGIDTGMKLESTLFAGLFATEDKDTGINSYLKEGPGKATFSGR